MEPTNTPTMQTAPNMNMEPAPKSSNKMVFVLLLLVIVVIVVIFAMKNRDMTPIPTETGSMQTGGDTTSAELNSIEAELNSVDTTSLDAGLE